MKRSVVALGILGLVCAVALPAAHAGVLWQPDLSKGNPLQGVNAIYRQGVSGTDGDRSTATDVGTAPFLIDTDSTSRKNLWLDGGASDNVSLGDGYSDIDGSKNSSGDVSAPFMLLTGDAAKWADVQITTKMDFWDQNTGAAGLVLRAAAKTKFSDPDSFYMFQLTTGNSNVLDSMARDGITQPNDTSKNPDGSDEGYTLRILKVVKGKWTMLAEINQDKTSIHIPQINRLGIDHDVKKGADDGNQDEDLLVGGYFRFVAKGDALTGFVSMDGKTFSQILQAHDSDLTAGLVGFSHYDHRPLFKEILVEDAP